MSNDSALVVSPVLVWLELQHKKPHLTSGYFYTKTFHAQDAINFVFLSQSHPAIAIMIPNKQWVDVFTKLSINILTE